MLLTGDDTTTEAVRRARDAGGALGTPSVLEAGAEASLRGYREKTERAADAWKKVERGGRGDYPHRYADAAALVDEALSEVRVLWDYGAPRTERPGQRGARRVSDLFMDFLWYVAPHKGWLELRLQHLPGEDPVMQWAAHRDGEGLRGCRR